MKLKLFLFAIVSFVCQPAFLKQLVSPRVTQNFIYYNSTVAITSLFSSQYQWIIANQNTSMPIPGVATIDNSNMDALQTAACIITILKGKVKIKGSQVIV